MTLRALEPELAAVHVVLAMAATALRRQTDVGRRPHRIAMARVAIEAAMRAVEREAGLRRVVERPDQPIGGVMAHRAVRAEPARMDVVFDVAVDAGLLRVEE